MARQGQEHAKLLQLEVIKLMPRLASCPERFVVNKN